jgi:uncharacterized protein involved in exopolysaccharide biosynthesis
MRERIAEVRPIYLSDVIGILRRHVVLIAAATSLTTVLAASYAFLATPVYRSEVLFTVVQRDQNAGALGGLGSSVGLLAQFVGGGILGQSSSPEAAALLTSRTLAEEFFEANQVIPLMFPDLWDPEANAWIPTDDKDIPTVGAAFGYFDEDIRFVETDSDTGLMMLSIEWRDRHLAQQWASSIVELANERQRASAVRDATESIEYLKAQLEKTDVVEIRQAIFAVMEQQLQAIMLANVTKEYAYKVIDPAVVADEEAFVRPMRLLIIALGLIGGFLLGAFIAITRDIGPDYAAR